MDSWTMNLKKEKMNFKEFMKIESTIGDLLKSVPQNKKHHAEGDVFTHTRMVRSRLPMAINFVKNEQLKNPDSVFSNLDMNITPQEEKILKMAAWFHDIGKASATKVDLDTGKITAHAHEHPKHYMPQIEKLQGPLKDIYNSLSESDKDILHFIIDNHMSLNQETGLPKKLWTIIFDDDGKIKNEIKPKLLITLMIMDRTGRIRGEDFEPHIQSFKQKQELSKNKAHKEFSATFDPLHLSVDKHLRRLQNIKNNS